MRVTADRLIIQSNNNVSDAEAHALCESAFVYLEITKPIHLMSDEIDHINCNRSLNRIPIESLIDFFKYSLLFSMQHAGGW